MLGERQAAIWFGKEAEKEEASTGFLFQFFTETQSRSRRDLGQPSSIYQI